MNKRLIVLITAGLVLELLCILTATVGDIMKNINKFCFLYMVSFIVYIFAVFFILKMPSSPEEDKRYSGKILWTILVFSLIFRLSLLPLTPSNDMFRYVWEGRLQVNGLNPYSYPPESSTLEHLRDKFYSGIGHKQLTTIYPPLTLMIFAIAELFSHSFLSMKTAFLTFDVLSIFLLVKFLRRMGKEPVHVLIYAWSPLVLMSFAARGHCDSLQIFFVILALYLYSMKKQIQSFISISLATMSKFVSIITIPFLIPRGKFKYLIILFLVILLLYSPYSSAGSGLFSTLFHFGTQYHYNDSVHFLIFCLYLGSPFISKIITIIILCSVIFCFYKKHLQKNPIETTLDTDITIITGIFWEQAGNVPDSTILGISFYRFRSFSCYQI